MWPGCFEFTMKNLFKKNSTQQNFWDFCSFTRESWRCKTLACCSLLACFFGDHGNPGISNPLYSELGVIQLRQLCQTRAPKTETKASCELKPQSKSKYWKLDYLQWWFCSMFFNHEIHPFHPHFFKCCHNFNFNLNQNFPSSHPLIHGSSNLQGSTQPAMSESLGSLEDGRFGCILGG